MGRKVHCVLFDFANRIVRARMEAEGRQLDKGLDVHANGEVVPLFKGLCGKGLLLLQIDLLDYY